MRKLDTCLKSAQDFFPGGGRGVGPRPERVVVLHDFSEVLGGASHLVQVLIGQLRARGIPVTFIAGDTGAHFMREDVAFMPLGGKDLLAHSRPGALAVGLHNPVTSRSVREWIRMYDTPGTIYHLHGWSKVLSPSVFVALKPVARRLVLHAHDYFNACPNGGFFDYREERDCELEPLSRACLARRCDKNSQAQKLWRVGREALRRYWLDGAANVARMLLIHPGQARLFRQGGWPEDRLHAVRNPVTPPCHARVRAEANRGVLFLGRISREKGADLAALAAKEAGVPITFVGEGADEAALRALHPGARFLGRLDRDGVAQAMAQARVAVMPSRWSEPFGLVALEAIGSGLPVIASERALVGPEIAEAGFGLALDTADITQFAAGIAKLHADDALAREFSEAGRAHYRDLCHGPESWADAVVDHYGHVLRQSWDMGSALQG